MPDFSKPRPPFAVNENLGQFVRYQTIKDKEVLTVFWALPDLSKEVAMDPAYYFKHLLGHEGKNSVLSFLKKEGLALELTVKSENVLDGTYSYLIVEVTLTKKGFQNYESVAAVIFQYIKNLRLATRDADK